MNKRALLVALLALTGCDKVVRSTLVETRTETGEQRCTHAGFCMHYGMGMGFDGKMKGGMKFGYHYACGGSQPAEFEVKTYRLVLESGKTVLRSDRSTVRTLGECQ